MDIDRINKLTTPKGEVVRIKRKSDGVTIWRKPYLKLYDWIATCGNIRLVDKNITGANFRWFADIKFQYLYNSLAYGSSGSMNYALISEMKTGSSTDTTMSASPQLIYMTGSFNGTQFNGYITHQTAFPVAGTTAKLSSDTNLGLICIPTLHNTADFKERYPVMETNVSLDTDGTQVTYNASLLRNDIEICKLTGTKTVNTSYSIKSTYPDILIKIDTKNTYICSQALYRFTLYGITVNNGALGVNTITSCAPYLKLRPAIKDDQLGLWDEVEERIYPCTSPETALYGYGKMNPADY